MLTFLQGKHIHIFNRPKCLLASNLPIFSPVSFAIIRAMHMLTSSDIDEEINPRSREAILSLIRAEHPENHKAVLHPNIPELPELNFSPAIRAEHERIEKKLPIKGIDKSRFDADALEPPERTTPHSDESRPELLKQWREVLQRAYSTSTYLTGRTTNLSLLETYGKNAWLIGNDQLEQLLKDLETDYKEAKGRAEAVEQERRIAQEGAKAEMDGLDQSWKKGLRGIIEVEIATDGLRREILERRRAGVGG
jgi:pre-mRNA-splicing factor SPF27